MRHQAGGVAVVATGDEGARAGLTATAVASVSDAPPTLLVCVNQSASAHATLVNVGTFSVNFLSRSQDRIADAFSGRTDHVGEHRFSIGAWTTLATGAPILTGAIASLDCRLDQRHESGTHSIFIGTVIETAHSADAAPLVYFRSRYWSVGEGA
ncbi:MAG: flavin reductase family protein [Pseudomonadota bacterium]